MISFFSCFPCYMYVFLFFLVCKSLCLGDWILTTGRLTLAFILRSTLFLHCHASRVIRVQATTERQACNPLYPQLSRSVTRTLHIILSLFALVHVSLLFFHRSRDRDHIVVVKLVFVHSFYCHRYTLHARFDITTHFQLRLASSDHRLCA